jgi:hypothetical protein
LRAGAYKGFSAWFHRPHGLPARNPKLAPILTRLAGSQPASHGRWLATTYRPHNPDGSHAINGLMWAPARTSAPAPDVYWLAVRGSAPQPQPRWLAPSQRPQPLGGSHAKHGPRFYMARNSHSATSGRWLALATRPQLMSGSQLAPGPATPPCQYAGAVLRATSGLCGRRPRSSPPARHPHTSPGALRAVPPHVLP